jgi:hypothetical protein
MKQLCLILAIIAFPTLGFSQSIGDTLIVFVDNRVEIKVAVPDYENLKTSDSVLSALKEFKSILPDIKDQLSSDAADLITYSVGGPLTIKPGDPKIIYISKEGKLNNTGSRDHAILVGEEYKIFITTSDMSKITDLSLSICLEKVIAILPEKTRWSKSLYFECIDENVKLIEDKANDLDMMELSLGAGAGLIKSQWVSDISFKIGLGLKRKGVIQGPYISSNLVFDFNEDNTINLNTFLNVGYQWDLDKTAEKPNVIGVELGYLVSKQGDLFGENTFKFGVNWSPAKHINVSPQLYITDNFKTVYPGIRIGFGL